MTLSPLPVIVSPEATVDVAPVPVRFKYVEASPPENVEVELLPTIFRNPCSVEVPAAVPCNVVVAVDPIYMVSVTENLVLDA